MQSKTVVYLGIIICGIMLAQVIPFASMFGVGGTLFFIALFTPYFGKFKSYATTLTIGAIIFLLNIPAIISLGSSAPVIINLLNIPNISAFQASTIFVVFAFLGCEAEGIVIFLGTVKLLKKNKVYKRVFAIQNF